MRRVASANLDSLKRPRLLATVGAVVLLLGIWYLAWWSPEGHKLASVQAQQQQAQLKVDQLRTTLAAVEHESAIVQKYRNFLTFFGSEVPVQPEQGQLVYMLGKLERADAVQVTSIDVSTTAPAAAGSTLSEIPVTMSVSGPHDNVIKFLSDLYQLPRLITIQSIDPAVNGSTGGGPGSSYDILGHDSVPFTLSITGTAYFSGTLPASPAG